MHQQGLLTINLDPNCVSFLSENGTLTTTNCSDNELIKLLIDLGFEMEHWPLAECIVRLHGNFRVQTLTSVGLTVAPVAESNAA